MKSSTEQLIFKKREIVVSDQSSTHDISEAHLEAAYRDMHQQVSQEVIPRSQKYAERHVYEVDQVSTIGAHRERTCGVHQMVTIADFQR
jgi:hypothetical protein